MAVAVIISALLPAIENFGGTLFLLKRAGVVVRGESFSKNVGHLVDLWANISMYSEFPDKVPDN